MQMERVHGREENPVKKIPVHASVALSSSPKLRRERKCEEQLICMRLSRASWHLVFLPAKSGDTGDHVPEKAGLGDGAGYRPNDERQR